MAQVLRPAVDEEFRGDCLVVHAVIREPVSSVKSLLRGKDQGLRSESVGCIVQGPQEREEMQSLRGFSLV